MKLTQLVGLSHRVHKFSWTNPESMARVKSAAAPSRAPPNRSPIVKRPATRDETRSFPARVVMIVVIAPDTAGPFTGGRMGVSDRSRMDTAQTNGNLHDRQST